MDKAVSVAAIALVSGCASWTPHDTYREAACLGLIAVDYGQTMTIAANPDKFYERNPILGKHPSGSQVTTYFAGAALLHAGVSAALTPKWRKIWQYTTMGVEAGVVGHNFSIGIGVSY